MITNASAFYTLLKSKFKFTPTSKQDQVLIQLSQFVFDKSSIAYIYEKGMQEQEKQVL